MSNIVSPYDEFAVSEKITSQDDTPGDWRWLSLGSVTRISRQTVDPASYPEELFDYFSIPAYQEGSQPLLERGCNIRSLKLLVGEGAVLFGKLNPRVPKVWLVERGTSRRMIASTEFIPLVPDPDHLTSQFLKYLCWSHHVMPKSQELVSGSTPSRQRVDVKAFQQISVPVPPLPEQRAIAHVLRTVQQAREATEQVIAAARELKRSLMRHLLTYGPVPVDQADQVPLTETEFGFIPEHWQIHTLGEIAHVQTGVAKGRKLRPEDGGLVEVPYLRVANVQDGYLNLGEVKTIPLRRSELPRYQLRADDVVVTEGGDFDKLGRGFIWRDQVPGAVHQNHIFAIRPHQSRVLPEFLAYLIQSHHAKRYFLKVAHRTTNLASINSTKLKAFPAPVPTVYEQREVVEALNCVDDKLRVEESKRDSLAILFDSLLHHLMTGKVRVSAGECVTEMEEVGLG
jgi:type I restriction enzyme, S subunit